MSTAPCSVDSAYLPEIDHATRVFLESINGFVAFNGTATDPPTMLLLSIVHYLKPAVAALDGILNAGYPPRRTPEPPVESPRG